MLLILCKQWIDIYIMLELNWSGGDARKNRKTKYKKNNQLPSVRQQAIKQLICNGVV
jgi:hypothetical protein